MTVYQFLQKIKLYVYYDEAIGVFILAHII